MPHPSAAALIVTSFGEEERELVRLSAAITTGGEAAVREQLARAAARVRPQWVEELILQAYLFAGFPRALNAAREWRRVSGRPAPQVDEGERHDRLDAWREAGERTCRTVYGAAYDQLRRNIRALHPALDDWMIVDGYGKVLSRPGLDLARRELCIVAACAAGRQERQLHSHLHGALHAGAAPETVTATLNTVADLLPADALARYRALWDKVQSSPLHVH